jgi:hypothetical protein
MSEKQSGHDEWVKFLHAIADDPYDPYNTSYVASKLAAIATKLWGLADNLRHHPRARLTAEEIILIRESAIKLGGLRKDTALLSAYRAKEPTP